MFSRKCMWDYNSTEQCIGYWPLSLNVHCVGIKRIIMKKYSLLSEETELYNNVVGRIMQCTSQWKMRKSTYWTVKDKLLYSTKLPYTSQSQRHRGKV
ncbi:hypothetical protein T07_8821 [Trichinella nelsoni]|uniref:Uncharacterized protein n=1 Tax=Trichinella nelsoni TaxID=6336 RepID=A0A0V0S1C6_9BILA|nr:hypothetical protein T07_8821 [Trichinella nelsoni]